MHRAVTGAFCALRDFYLHPEHDAALVRKRLTEIAESSSYRKPETPITVIILEKPWGTHYRLKAYVKESREQFLFIRTLRFGARKRFGPWNTFCPGHFCRDETVKIYDQNHPMLVMPTAVESFLCVADLILTGGTVTTLSGVTDSEPVSLGAGIDTINTAGTQDTLTGIISGPGNIGRNRGRDTGPDRFEHLYRWNDSGRRLHAEHPKQFYLGDPSGGLTLNSGTY